MSAHISPVRNVFNLPFAVFYFFLSIILVFVNLCIPRKKYHEIQNKQKANETRSRLEGIKGFVHEGNRVLDVGCGNGQFGESIAKEYKAVVSGVDVVDYAAADIPIHTYDGYSLPFEDDSFDVIIMAFMLHHVKHQDKIFKEVVRCSKSTIIIMEDIYFSPWQRLFVVWNDFHSNILTGFVKIVKGLEGKELLGMPMPFTFRSVKGWHKFFHKYSLNIESTAVRHSSVKPHSKVTFCLKH